MTRGRKPNVESSTNLNLSLPESWRAKLDLLLFSELESRVPKGAYQRFFLDRLAEFFASRSLDLSPYLGSMPGERTVRGTPQAIEALERALKGQT